MGCSHRQLEYCLIFIESFYFPVDERISTNYGAEIATLTHWPTSGNTPFYVRFKIKIVTVSASYSTCLQMPTNYRYPGFFIRGDKIHSTIRATSSQPFIGFGSEFPLTLDQYHSIELTHTEESDCSWMLKLYINGEFKAQMVNELSHMVYNDVAVKVAQSANGAVYYMKDIDWGAI